VPRSSKPAAPVGSARPAPPAGPPTGYESRPWLASYPAGVPADYDFPTVAVTRLLDDAAAAFPGNVALAFLGATITYAQLKDSVDRFATALSGLGVGKGDGWRSCCRTARRT